MGISDSPSRGSVSEKSGIDTHFFDEGELLDLDNHDVEELAKVEDVE